MTVKQFNLRLPPELHAVVTEAARLEGKSVNGYLNRLIDRAMYEDEVIERLENIETILKANAQEAVARAAQDERERWACWFAREVLAMTEEEKYEIATLATELSRKRDIYLAYSAMNTPTDPIEREKSAAAYTIVVTEYLEADAALSRAQARIANK